MSAVFHPRALLALATSLVLCFALVGCNGQQQPGDQEPAPADPAVETPTDEEPAPAATDDEPAPADEEPAPADEEPAPGDEAAADPSEPLKTAEPLVKVDPEVHNTPDGMCVLPSGDVLVSVPNINDESQPPAIMKLTKDNELVHWYTPPKHPETGKAYPFGICRDPDSGDIYYADLQWFAEKACKGNSRVVRIPMEGGEPGEAEVVVEGMHVANAVVVRDGYLYVSDTSMVPMEEGDESVTTGVYKIDLADAPVTLKQPLEEDPHCIATILSYNTEVAFGADGLTFDSDGNMYIGNFADGTLHKVEFDDEGNVTSEMPVPIWAKAPFMKSCDGIFFCPHSETIYVADSIANAVQMVSLEGDVQCLAQEPTDDGLGGKLDQPAEVAIRDGDVIVSNFDMPVPGGVNQTFEVPNWLSIIRMD